MRSKHIFQRLISFAIGTGLLLAATTPAFAYMTAYTNRGANMVLGQATFTGSAGHSGAAGLTNPGGVTVDVRTHKVFVSDRNKNRVLRFASLYALSNGASAEAVLGQADFTSGGYATTQSRMHSPNGVAMDTHGRLWVADAGNNRVLRFDNAANLPNGANATAVLGQVDFTHSAPLASQSRFLGPAGVSVDASGRLWVADLAASRVLRFDNAAAKANGDLADGVLGQTNYSTVSPSLTRNHMELPSGVYADAAGRLWVADTASNRVLRFDHAASKANGANADAVLGQPNFTSGSPGSTGYEMNHPTGVALDDYAGRLFVTDWKNNWILVYRHVPALPNGSLVSAVIGQPDFTTVSPNTGGISQWSLSGPTDVFFDSYARVLMASDATNNRVLMYGTPSLYVVSRSAAANDGWIAESGENTGVGGAALATGTLLVGDNSANRQLRSILHFDTSAMPDSTSHEIRAVRLNIKKAGFVGSDPMLSFGALAADIRKGVFGTSGALEIGDFEAIASAANIGHFKDMGNGWFQLVAAPSAFKFVNRTGVTEFRLRFTTDDNNNSAGDYDYFYAGDSIQANRPYLQIEYTNPP